jgi:hypothetical protein
MTTDTVHDPYDATPAPLSLEEQLGAALGEMRAFAAELEGDDYYRECAQHRLDRRPLMLIAIARRQSTALLVMEPGTGEGREGVMAVALHYFPDGDAPLRHVPVYADLDLKGYLLTQLDSLIDWIDKENTGDFVSEGARTGPLPACVTGTRG